ncbi:MAG: hypothetical protein ABIB47_00105 [Candidatus Woesearchaeota archaeon]
MADIDKCILCGLCRQDSSLLKITGKETVTSRGKAILIKKGILDKIFFIDPMNDITVAHCPTNVEITEEIRKQREKMVEHGMETKPNRRMIENLRDFGNPYGEQKKQEIKEVFS